MTEIQHTTEYQSVSDAYARAKALRAFSIECTELSGDLDGAKAHLDHCYAQADNNRRRRARYISMLEDDRTDGFDYFEALRELQLEPGGRPYIEAQMDEAMGSLTRISQSINRIETDFTRI